MTKQTMLNALIGYPEDEVDVHDPGTWTCNGVKTLLHNDEVHHILQAALQLEKHSGKSLRSRGLETTEGAGLDDFLWLCLDRLVQSISAQQQRMIQAFARFNTDGHGLDFQEFGQLLDFCLEGYVPLLTTKEKMLLFSKLDHQDGTHASGPADDLDDPVTFARAVTRSTYPLALPMNTRDYWQLPEE